jgi:predicted SprT family Zn-dependent metalloprotease
MAQSTKQRRCLAVMNFDLFTNSQKKTSSIADSFSLPDELELKHMFMRINFRYFSGKLPEVKIEWSNRLRMAGKYIISDRIIRLGRRYHEYFPEEVENTLKHEMIHILYPDHGRLFKSEAIRIGASRYAREYPGARGNFKYIYVCPGCGEKFYRRKRYRLASCGRCSRNGYDQRYKLKLIWSAKRKGKTQ